QGGSLRRRIRRARELAQQFACDCGVQRRFASVDGTDRLEQLLGRSVFEQVAHRPSFEGREHQLILRETGQDKDTRARKIMGDLTDGGKPILAWHNQVQQDHVGLEGTRFEQRLSPVLGFADHEHARLRRDQCTQALSYNGMIISQQNANGFHQLVSLNRWAGPGAVRPPMLTWMRVPCPGAERIVKEPPSPPPPPRMESSPTPPFPSPPSRSKPCPSSAISTSTACAFARMCTVTVVA